MRGAVVVFAKIPFQGHAKTRIASEVGTDKAEAIYKELLEQTGAQVSGLEHFVSYSGEGDPGPLKRYFPEAKGFLSQVEEDLGLRVRHALEEVAVRGYDMLCAVGTDCPYLTPDDLVQAFHLLEAGEDVVIGPALDGGYYLIALHDPGCGLFSVKGWSTENLLAETRAFLIAKALAYRFLEEKGDIDTWDDYQRWRADSRE